MLEINNKEDILIPFDKIGDENWALKTQEILKSIAYNYHIELMDSIPNDEIDKLENRLGIKIPKELKEFYKNFGIAEIGEELQDFDEIDWIKNIWKDTEYGPEFSEEDKKYLPFLISFSNYLGNGNMFCFHSETKEIYYFNHEEKPYLTKIFDNVEMYLKCCLIFVQSELFGNINNSSHGKKLPDMVHEWTEKIVIGIIGAQKVRKWRY